MSLLACSLLNNNRGKISTPLTLFPSNILNRYQRVDNLPSSTLNLGRSD